MDLAFLSAECIPIALLEAKALYAFDLFNEAGKVTFSNAVRVDEDKLRRIKREYPWPTVRLFCLLLVTHLRSVPTNLRPGVVKYLKRISELAPKSSAEVAEALRSGYGASEVASGEILAGTWFGAQVSVYYLLREVRDIGA